VTLTILAVVLLLGWLFGKSGRQDPSKEPSREDLRIGFRLLAWMLWLGCLSHSIVKALDGGFGWLWLLLPIVLLLPLLRPLFLLDDLLVPRGLVRLTYRTTLVMMWLHPERRGHALLYGYRALLRAPRHRDLRADEAYLEERAKKLSGGAVSLVAAALQLAQREGLGSAVPLVRCLDSLDESVSPSWAMAVAQELLLVELMRLGDWSKVRALTPQCEASSLIAFVDACAKVFVPQLPGSVDASVAPPSRDRLYWLWLKVPQKQHLLWLLDKAQDFKPQAAGSAVQPASEPQHDKPKLDAALAALGKLWKIEPHMVGPEHLRRVGLLWDAALADKDTERLAMTRALTLTIPGSEHKALASLRAQVVETLRSYLGDGQMPISKLFPDGNMPTQGVLVDAVLAVRAKLLEQFESATTQLEERTTDQRSLPWLDEWREWATIRDAYQRIEDFGGAEARRLAWTSLHRQANNWACWLWNARSEKVLANAVFRFLLRESLALGDDRTAQLAKKNVGSGL
jgi:hypothetical protein